MAKVRAVELLGSGSSEAHIRITLDDRSQKDLTLNQDALRQLLHAARLPYLGLADARSQSGRTTRMLQRTVEAARQGGLLVVVGVDARQCRSLYLHAIEVAGNYSVRTVPIKEYVALQVGQNGRIVFDSIDGHRTWSRDEYTVVYDHAAQDHLTREWCAAWQEL